MIDDRVTYEVRDEIAFVTLNRPEKLNALTKEMTAALADAWGRLEADATAKVAILRGTGTAFCAGADLTADGDSDVGCNEMPWRVQIAQAFPKNGIRVFKPIIGCVQGYAVGAGYALAVKGCDITIAGESALLGYPESIAGIASPPIEYVPYMPFKVSLEFALLAWKNGRLIDANRAHQLGIVNTVVSDDQLDAEAVRWANLLKQVPPLYIKSIKYGHYKSVDTARWKAERDYFDFVWPQEVSKDREEARQAFRDKRPPTFVGR